MQDTVLGVLEAMTDSQAAYHLIERKYIYRKSKL